ncbi:MAG TPA: MFS transporter, partial [Candidatus Limnocylindrales bacterium]
TMASAAVPPTLRTAASGREPSVRRFGFAVRRQWLGPVVIVFLTLVHWGVLSTYLPARAERAGADIGLFFAADGIAIVLSRVPTGWVADRVSWRLVVGCGLALLLASLGLAALPPTTPLLALSGALNGAGAAIALTPNLVELTRRSDDEDRGSALALYGATLAGGLSVGSVAAAPIVAMAGFEGAVGLGLLGLVAAGTVLLLAERDRPMASVEVAPIGPP